MFPGIPFRAVRGLCNRRLHRQILGSRAAALRNLQVSFTDKIEHTGDERGSGTSGLYAKITDRNWRCDFIQKADRIRVKAAFQSSGGAKALVGALHDRRVIQRNIAPRASGFDRASSPARLDTATAAFLSIEWLVVPRGTDRSMDRPPGMFALFVGGADGSATLASDDASARTVSAGRCTRVLS